jgi:predicted PurR-regulated permease PerM
MIVVYLIVGILNSLSLLILGVRHAILFGMLCAIMTIIPYIGIFVSAMLPISVVWLDTGSVWYPVGVVAAFSIIQYLEANVIFPKVVGTQLHVSTMAMLVAVVIGGLIWGVAGMVLFIPFVAILKIISDNIKEWEPINLLLSRK